jgi:hypothetical protein
MKNEPLVRQKLCSKQTEIYRFRFPLTPFSVYINKWTPKLFSFICYPLLIMQAEVCHLSVW